MTTTRKCWTKREINRMKAMRQSGMTWAEIGAKLNRPAAACARKGHREGFVYARQGGRYWTPEEDAMIIAGLEALSDLTGRPIGAVASHVFSLLTAGRFREETPKLKVVA